MIEIKEFLKNQLEELHEQNLKANVHNKTEIARNVGKREAFLSVLNFLESERKND